MKKLLIAIAMLGVILIMARMLWAGEVITEEQAIKTIMGEARGEPYKGQVAVAEVLRRRNSLVGFYGYRSNFTPTQKEIDTARRAWKESIRSNYSMEATHFEGDRFKTPSWAKGMKEVAHIGHQRFFKEVV
jgi:spore germination cell wall hydrolase CwlJ-like protein